LIDSFKLHSETLPATFHLGYRGTLPGTPNVKGEAQEIKSLLLNSMPISPFREGHKSCLLFVELQSVFLKTLDKRTQNAFGIALIGVTGGKLRYDAMRDDAYLKLLPL